MFGPKEFTRRDLMALNIQRAREHGVPGFNAVREAFKLPAYSSWMDMAAGDAEMATLLEDLYDGDIGNVDLWVGGMLEAGTTGPGQTFVAILRDQFTRIRDGDRWYFEYSRNGLFSADDVAAIKATKLSDILKRNGVDNVQDDVFFHLAGDVCPQPYQLNGSLPEHLNECSPLDTFDYYVRGCRAACARAVTGRRLALTHNPRWPVGVGEPQPHRHHARHCGHLDHDRGLLCLALREGRQAGQGGCEADTRSAQALTTRCVRRGHPC